MFNSITNYINDKEFKVYVFIDKVNVINYIEIITLDKERVSLKHDKGIVIIKGNNLVLSKLLDDEILITGQIKTVELG